MPSTYLTLKSLHLLGIVLFLGNIIVTGWWKVMADRTRDPRIIAFAQRQVTLTDWVFTVGGATLLLVAGLANIPWRDGMPIFEAHWLAWGVWLFVASGVIWAAVLVPIQTLQARMARDFAESGVIPERYWRLGRQWIVWGSAATVLPLLNLYWMVFKPV